MASLGEIVVIAQGMQARFGAGTKQRLAKEIATHMCDGDTEAAEFWRRVVEAMTVLDRPRNSARRESRH